MNIQNHFVFLQPHWLAQSYFPEHSNPTSHHPSRKKKEKEEHISECQEPSDSKKNTSFSGFISHISSHDTFLNAAEGPDFKGWVSHYLIPT